MSNFVSNLVSRHTAGGNYVLPRFRGKFEPPAHYAPAEKAAHAYFPGDAPAGEAPYLQTASSRPFTGQQPPAVVEQEQVTVTAHQHISTLAHQQAPLDATEAAAQDMPPVQPLPAAATYFNAPFIQPSPVGNKAAVNFNNPAFQPAPQWPALKNNEAQDSAAGPLVTGATVNKQSENDPAKHLLHSPFTIHPSLLDSAATAPVDQAPHTANQSLYFTAASFNQRQDVNQVIHQHQHHQHHQHSTTETPPVIKVTIGRIEVRAVSQPAPVKTREAPPAPAMSLDDFLKKRNSHTP